MLVLVRKVCLRRDLSRLVVKQMVLHLEFVVDPLFYAQVRYSFMASLHRYHGIFQSFNRFSRRPLHVVWWLTGLRAPRCSPLLVGTLD